MAPDEEKGNAAAAGQKIACVLTDQSLNSLAKSLVSGRNTVTDLISFCMMLNIPTKYIVNAKLATDRDELPDFELGRRLLYRWRDFKATCKERDKVQDMERAFRQWKGELGEKCADIFMDKYRNQEEIQADTFTDIFVKIDENAAK